MNLKKVGACSGSVIVPRPNAGNRGQQPVDQHSRGRALTRRVRLPLQSPNSIPRADSPDAAAAVFIRRAEAIGIVVGQAGVVTHVRGAAANAAVRVDLARVQVVDRARAGCCFASVAPRPEVRTTCAFLLVFFRTRSASRPTARMGPEILRRPSLTGA